MGKPIRFVTLARGMTSLKIVVDGTHATAVIPACVGMTAVLWRAIVTCWNCETMGLFDFITGSKPTPAGVEGR